MAPRRIGLKKKLPKKISDDDGARQKPGPKPEHLRAEGVDWQDALKHALSKPKPPKGWDEGEVVPSEQGDEPGDSDEPSAGD